MEEYSRIIIEEYCRNHKTKKSDKLAEYLEMSYDLNSEGTDYDAMVLDDLIERERIPELKEAIIDLKDFIFPL